MPSQKETAKAMVLALNSGLLESDKAMLYAGLLVVNEEFYEAEYNFVYSVKKKDGKTFGQYRRDHAKIFWEKLSSIKIYGPVYEEKTFINVPLTGEDYYRLSLFTDGFLGGAHHAIHFSTAERAKYFAALVLRMAELWDNREVKLNP
jgi:hypothetical protein